MADIDELKFSIILDDSKFTQKMKEVNKTAERFEESVKNALNTSKLLDLAEKGLVKETKQKAKAQQDVLLLTRKELEAKKAAGTITKQELQQLKQIVAADKALLDEENKKLTAQKKQLDIENKMLTIQKKKEDAERRHAAAVEATNAKVAKQSVLMQQMTSYIGTYLSLYGGISLVRNLVRITGEFEAQHAALRAILQDASGADRIFYQLQELAVKSPYTFRDLTSYAKQLSAFSVPMDEIYETTKKLADVSAGLGVDMSRIILAYGQVRSAAFLRGQEVRQFTEAGIPILAELAKQFEEIEGHAVSTGEVFDRISKRQVPFEMVEEAFRRMTSEGGKFYNMQEVLAETVKGKVSNLQDAWEIMLSRIGDANSGLIKGTLNLVTELIKNYEKLGKVILEVAAAYGTYKAVLATTNTLQAAAAVSTRFLALTGGQVSALEVVMHRLFRTTKSGLTKIGSFIAKNPYAIAIAAAVAGITALILHIREMNAHIRETDKITTKALAKAEGSKSNIRYYIDEMKRAKEGTEEYNRARQQVISQSGNFISAHDAERLSLQNVDDVWVNICQHIEEATKLEAMESVTAEASAKKRETQSGIIEELIDYQKNHGLSRGEYNFVADYIAGRKSYSDLYNNPVSQKGRLFQRAVAWRKDYEEAERIYQETLARAKQNLDGLYGTGTATAPQAEKPLVGWRLKVDEYLKRVGGGTRGMEVNPAVSLADYIKKGAEALNAARDALKHTPKDDADYKSIEKEIEFYEGISEAIYGAGHTEFDNTTSKFRQNIKDAEALRKEQIDGLKQYFQDLKSLKAHYDKLKSFGVSDDVINGYFMEFFGRGIPAGGFKSAFEGIAANLEGHGDTNTARDVRNYAAGRDLNQIEKDLEDQKKAAEDARKELDKYLESLEKWEEKNIGELQGTGAGFSISKAIKDYRKSLSDADNNFYEAAKHLEAGTTNKMERQAGYGKLDEQWAKQRVNALVTLRNSVSKYADDIIREKLEKGGYDITNWNDKTLGQIYAIKKAISEVELPDDIREMLVDFPDILQELEDKLKKEKTDIVNNTVNPAAAKEWSGYAQKASKYLSKAASSMKEIASATHDEGLENTANAFSALADNLNAAAEGYAASGSWIGAVVGGVLNIFEQAITLSAQVEARAYEVRQAIQDIRIEAERTAFTESINMKTIFGDNPMGDAAKAISSLDALSKAMDEWENKRKSIIMRRAGYDVDNNRRGGGARGGSYIGHVPYNEAMRGYSDISEYAFRLSKSNWAESFIGKAGTFITIAEFAQKTGLELYDEYDNLNAKLIEAIISTGELYEGDLQLFKDAKKYSEEYAEAMEKVDDVLSSITDSIVTDLTDKIVDGWWEAGVAALNYADTLSDVAKTYAKLLVQQLLFDSAFDDATQQAIKTAFISKDSDKVMKLIAEAMGRAEDALPMAEAILSSFEPYVNRDGSGSDNSLGNGIKSITEDTANLLASYINAIRADVSFGRMQWERIAVAVEGQSGQYITLNDYMAQVAANTFDTAQNTQRILGELQSVIGAPGTSGSVVRVEMS